MDSKILIESPPPGKKTIFFDASAFKDSACEQRLANIIIHGFNGKTKSPSLAYGTASHKYRATLRAKGDYLTAFMEANKYYLPISIKLPPEEWRNLAHLTKTCAAYKSVVYEQDTLVTSQQFINGNATKLIEQKFAIKIYEDEEFVLMLSGTVDEIGTIQGQDVIVDCKTSSEYFNIAAALKVYQLSTQLMFYKYIVERLGLYKDVHCYIEGWFINKSSPTKFEKSDVFIYPSAQMTRFEEQLQETINNIISAFKVKKYRKNFLICDCSKFETEKVGLCRFFDLCANENDTGIWEFFFKIR
jgi:hypothetical protein